MTSIDVVNNRLAFSLFGIGKLHHAYHLSGAIKMVEEFMLHLIPVFNALECKVCVPIKVIPLERSNILFD